MSCLGFLSPWQRAALAASSAAGAPLSAFASPPADAGKARRVRALAGSADVAIRESAALSQYAPPTVLAELARDGSASVRRCVARNPRTPAGVLAVLGVDDDPHVRGWTAAHPATPSAVTELLAGDPHPLVQAVVAWAAGWPAAGGGEASWPT